jgi:hypothetical protein
MAAVRDRGDEAAAVEMEAKLTYVTSSSVSKVIS